MPDGEDFALLGDSALLSRRMEMRSELERLPLASSDYAALAAIYDRSTQEIEARASRAWPQVSEGAGQQATRQP
jgi:hypothetical protein